MNLKELAFKNTLMKPTTVTLEDPYTGEPLIDSKGVVLSITAYHSESTYTQNASKEFEKANDKRPTGYELIAMSIESITGEFCVDDTFKLTNRNKTAEKLAKMLEELDFIAVQVVNGTSLKAFAPKKLPA